MLIANEIITYSLLFLALYFEVFLLTTYFEIFKKDSVKERVKLDSSFKLPSVSILVPVWNEAETVSRTVYSILKLNYPQEKLFIYIIDDGSTDNTWDVIQRFAANKHIKLLRKENGGKHTALNYALEFVSTDLVGCLDADSFVHPLALMRIVSHFEDKEIMAVTPSIKIFEPRGILQLVQKAEYMFGIFLRRVFASLNAIYITPGPFSIFRKSVFDQVGGYRHAHNTEDMEIAMRMQKNNMKIGNAHDAFVYTIAPRTLRTLYKQRIRWVYGFIKNAIDYRHMFFRPQFGNLGMVVLPAAGFSIVSTMYIFGSTVYSWLDIVWFKIKEITTVGLYLPNNFSFDLFYLNTDVIVFVSIIAILGTLLIIVTSRGLAEEKNVFGVDSILFLLLYALIAPFWMTKAIYNVIFAKSVKWR